LPQPTQRRHEQLKRQFEVYYGDVRRKIDEDKKKGPTIKLVFLSSHPPIEERIKKVEEEIRLRP
jgi:Zn-dependent protease with chaperone function